MYTMIAWTRRSIALQAMTVAVYVLISAEI
jgi:uncharacterized membrane protein YidH (DUF202 family)